jgi:hypothetical protein
MPRTILRSFDIYCPSNVRPTVLPNHTIASPTTFEIMTFIAAIAAIPPSTSTNV